MNKVNLRNKNKSKIKNFNSITKLFNSFRMFLMTNRNSVKKKINNKNLKVCRINIRVKSTNKINNPQLLN